MTDQPRITIDAPSEMVILAARHLDATEGPVQVGLTVDMATRSAITTVLRYIAKAHNSPKAETAPAWTPPPPGDTREQLPDHLLDLIRPYLRGYTSTACQTAGYLAEAIADHPRHRAELAEWRERMRARCRTNQKYTGEICPLHPTSRPTMQS